MSLVVYHNLFGSRIHFHPAASDVLKVASGLLSHHERDPVFLFVNFMEPHDPYVPSQESIDKYQGIDGSDATLGILRRPGRSIADFMVEHADSLTAEELVKLRARWPRNPPQAKKRGRGG